MKDFSMKRFLQILLIFVLLLLLILLASCSSRKYVIYQGFSTTTYVTDTISEYQFSDFCNHMNITDDLGKWEVFENRDFEDHTLLKEYFYILKLDSIEKTYIVMPIKDNNLKILIKESR